MNNRYVDSLSEVIVEQNGQEVISLQEVRDTEGLSDSALDDLASVGVETLNKYLRMNNWERENTVESDVFTLYEIVAVYEFLRRDDMV